MHETAQSNEAHLQEALRTARVGAFYIDFRHNNRVWSREAAALMGLPPGQTPDYQQMLDAVHPEDFERVRATAQAAYADGSWFETDCRLVWADGSVHWISIKGRGCLDVSGKPSHVEGVLQDVEQRKRLEAELLDSQRTLYSLLSHMPGVVYRCRNDPSWSTEFVSEGMKALTGYDERDLMDRRVRFGDLIHPDDRTRIWDAIQAALRERRRYEVGYRLIARSGEEKWISEQGVGVYSPRGELQFREGFLTDVTESRRAEQEREQLEARLRQAQKMEALGTLAGGIAHDFNNVLAAIRGNAMLALEDLPADSPALASLKEIDRSATRAADLVRQILTFSRQESAQRRPIDLTQPIAEALQLLRATLPAMIEIRAAYAANLPLVAADPTQIHRVVMNLGVNAAQAIGARVGAIDVRLDAVLVASSARNSQSLPPGRYVRLRISDDGCGMEQATLERIYDPFFTTKPAGQGTGLGLSVVHGIVLAHEGAISVESTPNRGTTFCLCFPAAERSAAIEKSAAAPIAAGHGQRILFVDDEEALVSLAERALRRRGYHVAGYVAPDRALEAFRAQPEDFDFVVTDLSMPGMSGRDLAIELLRIRADIPIVLTSGYVTPGEIQAARSVGVRTVVLKPDSIDDLARVIDEVLASDARRLVREQHEHVADGDHDQHDR